MNQERRREINVLADKVRESLNLTVPVNVERTIELLGGVLKEFDEEESNEAYVQKQDDSFEIGVIRYTPPTRRRFSIAHELGHLFLHMGYLIDDDQWEKIDRYNDSIKFRYGYTEEEYEAHEFAGAFLMPQSEFRVVAEENLEGNKYDVNRIAEYFDVSTEAAANRGYWLGMFSWK